MMIPTDFFEYSNYMRHVYKNIGEYNLGKTRKVLIVFDDIIADTINNKRLNQVLTNLFIRGRKFDTSIFCYTIIF